MHQSIAAGYGRCTASILLEHALDLDWTGFGFSQRGPHGERFLHLDRLLQEPGRPRPWPWSY